MARQEIDLTTPQPNGKMGEPTKSAWEKVNDMTLELYSVYGITSGAYLSRPAAADMSYRKYFASDVKELYYSDGSSWVREPTGGLEIFYADRSSNLESDAIIPIPGLTATILVGEAPLVISFGGTAETSVRNYNYMALYMDNTLSSQIIATGYGPVDGSSNYVNMSRECRITGLTPGTYHTFELRFGGLGGNIARLIGMAGDKPYMQIRNC